MKWQWTMYERISLQRQNASTFNNCFKRQEMRDLFKPTMAVHFKRFHAKFFKNKIQSQSEDNTIITMINTKLYNYKAVWFLYMKLNMNLDTEAHFHTWVHPRLHKVWSSNLLVRMNHLMVQDYQPVLLVLRDQYQSQSNTCIWENIQRTRHPEKINPFKNQNSCCA